MANYDGGRVLRRSFSRWFLITLQALVYIAGLAHRLKSETEITHDDEGAMVLFEHAHDEAAMVFDHSHDEARMEFERGHDEATMELEREHDDEAAAVVMVFERGHDDEAVVVSV
ncbi:hypothetical protein L1049_008803 [Liquidambar formosana]|uniref:Uncharacterized protein n=1 Tax=Liquidambar formosana TaxID=63359 RepID=A0AAP0S3J9_LIQFO